MTGKKQAPKLEDVAREADVSTATVSRFVNNPAVVAKATADRIRAAIEKTGYIPNALAGDLASQRSRMVAVLIPHLENSLFSDMIERMVGELTSSGNNVMLGLTGTSQKRTDALVRVALARRVDAIVSTGPVDDDLARLVGRTRSLWIEVWDLPDNPVGIAIGFSHQDAGRDIARFLVSRGYRRPHLVTADSPRSQRRKQGFLDEWMELTSSVPTEAHVDVPTRFGHARRVFADLRHLEERPDVIICGSDHLAQGIIVEAQAAGLKVPDDLGVIGFGNNQIAGEMRPTITSIDVDGERIAREVMAAIKRHQEGQDFPVRAIDVGFRLIARESI
ncbi:LacI family gluconate utilization system Gnt-I transcriptional repressor [Altererythrobacter atlanticus]|uniref:HTH-type transcriptional regulator GntR n=1 Tax=Croceibacterium atlanticum TaxID=1267766 RepID=A0A0F7KS56_9SPHN|nr:LacI family DNA-binding transcriptional regulator [Croceibacterium atlanticum]AKH41951.1 HTH-type transcriptional regulator GntR [Croceibacterium atlanticum]MBB5733481.1 LacI family gluconate utilization system Gnt-I transcriptional repressor [Croceibacterium atlanticum]